MRLLFGVACVGLAACFFTASSLFSAGDYPLMQPQGPVAPPRGATVHEVENLDFDLMQEPIAHEVENLDLGSMQEAITGAVESLGFDLAENLVIEVTEGLYLPVRFSLTGHLLELDLPPGEMGISVKMGTTVKTGIAVRSTFYVKLDSGGLLFSLNSVDWYPLEEFMGGQISIGINFDEAEPYVFLFGELEPQI